MNNVQKRYNDVLLFSNGAHFKKDIQGWDTLYRNEKISDNTTFDVSVYKKDNRIVIAFAGTNMFSGKDYMNDSAIFRNKLPFQYYNAVNLYNKIITDKRYKNCNIEFVGYSLGGTISNLMSYYTGLPSTALAPIGSKNIANSAYYKGYFKYDDSNIVTFGRKGDMLFSNALKHGYQSGKIIILSDLSVNKFSRIYKNHDLNTYQKEDINSAKMYNEYGNNLQLKSSQIKSTNLSVLNNQADIKNAFRMLILPEKKVDISSFGGWKNTVTGSQQIYTKEYINNMSKDEIINKWQELNWQARKIGIPTDEETMQGMINYGNTVHVRAYTRADGTYVRSYVRSR